MQALQWQASNWFVPQLPGSGHELPHAPQLFGSPVMSVQVPKQSVWPDGQRQVPPLQETPMQQGSPIPPHEPAWQNPPWHVPLASQTLKGSNEERLVKKPRFAEKRRFGGHPPSLARQRRAAPEDGADGV
jgi:hypothetical protein